MLVSISGKNKFTVSFFKKFNFFQINLRLFQMHKLLGSLLKVFLESFREEDSKLKLCSCFLNSFENFSLK